MRWKYIRKSDEALSSLESKIKTMLEDVDDPTKKIIGTSEKGGTIINIDRKDAKIFLKNQLAEIQEEKEYREYLRHELRVKIIGCLIFLGLFVCAGIIGALFTKIFAE